MLGIESPDYRKVYSCCVFYGTMQACKFYIKAYNTIVYGVTKVTIVFSIMLLVNNVLCN